MPAEGRLGKVIRDSFTMPAVDHELIGILKTRCLGLGIAIKKSELLRAGLAALDRLPDESLAEVAAAVESVKTLVVFECVTEPMRLAGTLVSPS